MKLSIEKLTNLNGLVSSLDKADIILVWKKIKPAVMVELSYFQKPNFSKRVFHKKVKELEKILRDLKLEYKIRLNYPKSQKELTKYTLIAPNKKILEKLISAEAENDIYKRRLRFGALLGYPKTAAKAFADNKSISITDLPTNVRRKPELKFLSFRLSKNWRKEIAYLKTKANKIKKLAPELYQKITK